MYWQAGNLFFCDDCGLRKPCKCDMKIIFWTDRITEEPCPHCGKTKNEEGGGE